MTELIPDEAWEYVVERLCKFGISEDEGDSPFFIVAAINAAAPLIVAAELERWADYVVSDEVRYSNTNDIRHYLYTRAAELRKAGK